MQEAKLLERFEQGSPKSLYLATDNVKCSISKSQEINKMSCHYKGRNHTFRLQHELSLHNTAIIKNIQSNHQKHTQYVRTE